MEKKLDVLYEDNHLIVVVKPQNVPTQGDSSGDKSLLDMVKEYIKEKENKPGEAFVGLVHRLDRPTGGVMVFAKTSKSASRLSEQFKTDDVHKTYFAVVVGEPREKKGHLIHFLKKDEKNNMVEIVPASTTGAKRAELDYEVLETKEGHSLVRINLITGRSHQARIQMKSLGTPIYGDVKYGGKNAKQGLLNLFAVELRFEHPVSKDAMRFICYPPEQASMWKLFNLEKYLMIK
jgi:23S rRNA pseudouridine1911/1915/1917 synthase